MTYSRKALALLLGALLVSGCKIHNPLSPEPLEASADARAPGGDAAPGGAQADGEVRADPSASVKPDAPETARTPPKAEDLARYVADLGSDGKLMAKIETNLGAMSCELYEEAAPITVANFVGLARGLKAWIDPETDEPVSGRPLYSGAIFHRVSPDFMIQGGDPQGTGRGNPGYSIPDEFDPSAKHDSGGTLSMANAGPNTGGSQFFVTETATSDLDGRHTVFGRCDDASVDVVKRIARVPSDDRGLPRDAVVIEQIVISRE
ncbi:MAG: peptidylprolyl isomerase [Myxococcota bacterium]